MKRLNLIQSANESIKTFKSSIKNSADINLFTITKDTARIQKAHLFLRHHILNEVEKKLV